MAPRLKRSGNSRQPGDRNEGAEEKGTGKFQELLDNFSGECYHSNR